MAHSQVFPITFESATSAMELFRRTLVKSKLETASDEFVASKLELVVDIQCTVDPPKKL